MSIGSSVSARFPEAGRKMYEAGPKRIVRRIAEFLLTGVEAGHLRSGTRVSRRNSLLIFASPNCTTVAFGTSTRCHRKRPFARTWTRVLLSFSPLMQPMANVVRTARSAMGCTIGARGREQGGISHDNMPLLFEARVAHMLHRKGVANCRMAKCVGDSVGENAENWCQFGLVFAPQRSAISIR
jgi:hypothetical protein